MDIASGAPVAAARAYLRDACAGAHARLDARLAGVNFHDRFAYADLLSRLSAPLSALESGLSAGVAPVLFDNWAGRLRAPALRQDLAALGHSFHARGAAPIETEAEALGTLYVLEGSRLGAQVLLRQAQSSRDPDVRAATHYLGHGHAQGRGGQHWRTFLALLEASAAVRAAPARARAAALDAFAAFEAAFA